MSHNITPKQGIIEAKNIKAAIWANRIMTKKINNSTCKLEIAQGTSSDLVEDMEQRVRLYLKAGLVTAQTHSEVIDSTLAGLKKAARSKPIEKTEFAGGSNDGLWSKKL